VSAIVALIVLTGPSSHFNYFGIGKLNIFYVYDIYRHEIPVQNELSKQNIQDRFFGRSDPVARKILSGHAEKQGLTPPEDESVVRRLYA
jgi:hypothetical protein